MYFLQCENKCVRVCYYVAAGVFCDVMGTKRSRSVLMAFPNLNYKSIRCFFCLSLSKKVKSVDDLCFWGCKVCRRCWAGCSVIVVCKNVMCPRGLHFLRVMLRESQTRSLLHSHRKTRDGNESLIQEAYFHEPSLFMLVFVKTTSCPLGWSQKLKMFSMRTALLAIKRFLWILIALSWFGMFWFIWVMNGPVNAPYDRQTASDSIHSAVKRAVQLTYECVSLLICPDVPLQ